MHEYRLHACVLRRAVFTFRVQLHVDDVSHNRRVVERLHGHLGGFHRLENNFSYPQVLLVLRIVQDLHLLNLPEFFAHVSKESFPDVVVQSGECHLLGGDGADVALIDLRGGMRAVMSPECVVGVNVAPRGVGFEQLR